MYTFDELVPRLFRVCCRNPRFDGISVLIKTGRFSHLVETP